jgi:D-erythro-7,8-dihydroneopterin triphosphate epimerase
MTDVHGNHLAKVRIKDLLLRAYIGIKEEEINNQQDVLIIVALTYDASEAVQWAEVEIDKPHALRYAESVSVCLQAHR